MQAVAVVVLTQIQALLVLVAQVVEEMVLEVELVLLPQQTLVVVEAVVVTQVVTLVQMDKVVLVVLE